jgi:glutamate-1-semialdehyde 2,1-aminomutase
MTRYELSEKHLHRAELTIPLGSQTFSKSRTQFPVGVSPLYINRAKGCEVWDVDGNRYIDLVSSLASVTLGYQNRKVDNAVRRQLRKGSIFSLPGKIEAEVAEMICELVPSAEMVRFGKNGTDATTAAVRLARAYTGKNKVLVCGYHGWQDWYIGSTSRNKGVPKSVSELTESFNYNDIESFKNAVSAGDIACVVMEPMNMVYPNPGFLEEIREVTSRLGVVLIFDEIITGFRFSRGGAQELFGITPDLSTFGKGLSNGFPLSAVVGKREIMMEMENIFFSGTFGGELLSLAAGKSVLELHQSDQVAPRLAEIGDLLTESIQVLIDEFNLQDYLHFTGHSSWKFLNWRSPVATDLPKIKTLFMQEMFKNGVVVLGTHNVNLAMNKKAMRSIISAYRESLGVVSKSIHGSTLDRDLKCPPIQPLFRVR